MPARRAPPPPPYSLRLLESRTPKNGVHSAPEYVVGTETSGKSRAADAAFAVSIALPPPTATTASTPAGTSIRWDGISSQRAAGAIPRSSQRGLGNNRHAVPCRNRGLDRLLQPELELHLEIAYPQSGLAQLVLDHLADTRAFLHEDQRFLPKLVQTHRLAGEQMVRRHGEDDLVLKEGLEGNAATPRRRSDHAELELSAGDRVDDVLRVVDRERDRDVRIRLLKLAEEQREHRRPRASRAADLQPALELAFVLAGDL